MILMLIKIELASWKHAPPYIAYKILKGAT